MSWFRLSRFLVRCLPIRDRDRLGAELDGMLYETHTAAGIGPIDAASLGTLVARRWGTTAVQTVPLVLCGLPLAILPFMFVGFVYEAHFMPWDLMEEVDSSDPLARRLRWAYDTLFPIVGVLCLVAGARAIQYIRRGNFWFPALMVVASLVGISQSSLFLERTEWGFRNLRPSDVNSVSGWSLLMAALSVGLPIAFLAADMMMSFRSDRSALDPLGRKNAGPILAGIGVVAFVTMPFATPLLLPAVWLSGLPRRVRWVATAILLAIFAWVAYAIAIDD